MENTDNRVQELETALETQKQDYESRLLKMMVDHCLETALIKSGARSVKAAEALIDRDRIVIDDNRHVSGIEEQIKELKGNENTAFLFKEEVTGAAVPHEGADRPTEPAELTYEGYCAMYDNQ